MRIGVEIALEGHLNRLVSSAYVVGRGKLPKAGISAQARVWADVIYNRVTM
jgi:hypothetical protein